MTELKSQLRVLLEIGSMSDAPEEEGAEGDVPSAEAGFPRTKHNL
jgi:hypothetical protein